MWLKCATRALFPAAAAAAAVVYGCTGDRRNRFLVHAAVSEPPLSTSSDPLPRSAQQWDDNWDLRSPMNLVDPRKLAKADAAQREELLQAATSKAVRHLFLIRHGQYHLDAEEQNLTKLGQEQSRMTGERLRDSGVKFDKLIHSTQTRAVETAEIVLRQLDKEGLAVEKNDLLVEGYPCDPDPFHRWEKGWKVKRDGARIEAAFRRYFHRADPKQKSDSFELMVCHANVIRYFVCRALQIPPEAWLRMSLANCSITWVTMRPNGRVSVRSIGDAGHLDRGGFHTFT